MFKWLEQQTPIIDFSFFVKKYKYLLCKKILQGIYFLWVQIEKKRFLAKNLSVSLQKGNKDDGRRCLVGHDGAVVLWDELCRQSLHGWVGGTGGVWGSHCPSPPGGSAAVWLAVFFKVWFSVTFDLIREWVIESLLSGDTTLEDWEGLIFLIPCSPYP